MDPRMTHKIMDGCSVLGPLGHQVLPSATRTRRKSGSFRMSDRAVAVDVLGVALLRPVRRDAGSRWALVPGG
jgi:hypothetical protein